jgi:toxin ParE1/3/4
MRFQVSKEAEQDLDKIFVYWARHAGLQVADKFLEAIERRFALIGEFPHVGRKCGEIAPEVLSFPAGKYLIYYRKARGILQILHVFHGARNQASALMRDKGR